MNANITDSLFSFQEKQLPDTLSAMPSTILVRLARGLLLTLFFLTPLVISGSLEPVYVADKWLLLYLLTPLIVFCILFSSPQIVVPCIKAGATLLTSSAILALFFPLTQNRHLVYEGLILDIGLFFLLAYALYWFVVSTDRSIQKLALSNLVSLATVALFYALKYLIAPEWLNNLPFSDLFGSANYLSEFLATSFLLQFYCVLDIRDKTRWVILSRLAVLAIPIIILTLKSRSVAVGLVIAVCFYLVQRNTRRVTKQIRTFFSSKKSKVFFLLIFLLSVVSILTFNDLGKIKSAFGRTVMWSNSLQLIKDHPLGVGPSNFKYSYVNYKDAILKDNSIHESSLLGTPHNELLRITSVYGFPALFFTLAILWVLLRRLFQSHSWLPTMPYYPLFWGLFLFFLVESQFITIFEKPNTLLFCALLFAILLNRLENSNRTGLAMKIPLVVLSIYLLMGATKYATSSWVNRHFPNSALANAYACQLHPSNATPCLREIRSLLKQREWKTAQTKAQRMLARQPENFIAEKYLAFSLIHQGKKQKACHLLDRYDTRFNEKSSLHFFIEDYCQSLLQRVG